MASSDVRDRVGTYSVEPSEFVSGGVRESNGADIALCKSGCASHAFASGNMNPEIAGSSVVSSLSYSIESVVSLGAEKQVLRCPDARWVVAAVKNIQAGRNRANVELPSESMGHFDESAIAGSELSVAVAVSCAGPSATIVGGVIRMADLLLEPFTLGARVDRGFRVREHDERVSVFAEPRVVSGTEVARPKEVWATLDGAGDGASVACHFQSIP